VTVPGHWPWSVPVGPHRTGPLVEEALVTANGQLVAASPVDGVLSKLAEPGVAEALTDLLEHADLLAILVSGLDGLLRRSETIGNSVAEGIRDLREVTSAGSLPPGLNAAELTRLAGSLARLSPAVADAAPALDTLLRSELTDARAINVISAAARALVTGADRAAAGPPASMGVFALLRTLRDPDVSRGLAFLIQVAKAFGQQLASGRQPAPRHGSVSGS
jgi:hypothetical protein